MEFPDLTPEHPAARRQENLGKPRPFSGHIQNIADWRGKLHFACLSDTPPRLYEPAV
jgi:hypothetical protein